MSALKQRIFGALRHASLYHRLRTSGIHDLYARLAGRGSSVVRRKQLAFYRGLLPDLRPGDLIFDIGANEGFKTDLFLRLGARVVAIEPDETNQWILQQRFLMFRFARKPLTVLGKAVSDRSAVETMWIDGPGSAVNTLSRKWATTLNTHKERHAHANCGLDFARQKRVETTTMKELIATHGIPKFIKIDVEGYELNVIRGLPVPVPYLSFEVNLPEFRSEGLECVEILGKLSEAGRFNYVVDCEEGLALNRWLGADEFLNVLERCNESSIEVFWKGLEGEARKR